jgi:ATP-binding cassette subfamily F protein uup
MSCIINCQKISKRFSFKPLFENLSFSLHKGDRLGLLGNNGCGKSTLLKILMGLENPDNGEITKTKGLKIAYVSQFPHFESKPILEILKDNSPLNEEDALVQAKAYLSQASLDEEIQSAQNLSGGQKKKLDILRALMQEPDVIFLDEPTNHLDLDSVLWLENFLNRLQKTFLIVSHDRLFLDRVCQKFIEIAPMFPSYCFTHEGSLDDFFSKKQEWIEAETKRAQALSHKVEHEIAWMKRSPKARTTKSVFRSKKALELEQELKSLKKDLSKKSLGIELTASERETRLLIQAKNLTKSMGEKVLFKGLDLILSPGKKIGLLGKNGTGKTTLFKILSGSITPDLGTIKYADQLKIVLFDQHKAVLNDEDLVKDALCPSGEFVIYRGESIHVNGWAKRFLFSSDVLRLPVKKLSGGEKSRLLIAKLMLEEADVLLLDEPTNDLDIQTLEILEEALIDFPGSVMLISHDRFFLSSVCDYFLALGKEAEGQIYHDYLDFEEDQKRTEKKAPKETKAVKQVSKAPSLSSKEQKELKSIENEIASLEILAKKKEEEIQKMDPSSSLLEQQKHYQELSSFHEKIEALFLRWEELDKKNRS